MLLVDAETHGYPEISNRPEYLSVLASLSSLLFSG